MSTVNEIEELIQPVLSDHSFELVETQYRRESGRWVVRIFIDHAESGQPVVAGQHGSSVTLDDCEKVSDWVGAALDASDVLAEQYVLEVSSPGLNRPLKKERDFQRFAGENVKISLFAPLTGEQNQKNFAGRLVQCLDGIVELEDATSGLTKIPVSAIAKAHLDII